MSSTFIWAMTTSSLRDARDEARLDRQFGGGQRQRFFRGLHGHAVDFENHAAGLDPRHPQFRRALAGAHAHLGGLLGHRHVRENPDPDPAGAGAERGERGRHPVIDIGAQRVQRHPALAIPFHARDFRAAETARAVDTNAFGAETHRRLHRALHRAAECDAALELLGDRFGDQGGVEFGLADFDDVDDDVGRGDVGNPLAQLVDVGALLADHDAGTRRMDRHAALLVRTLDHDAGNGCLLEFLVQDLADLDVFMQELAVLVLAGEPTGIPRTVDAETQSDWIDLLTHRLLPRRFKRLPRPRPDEPRWSGARTVYIHAPNGHGRAAKNAS